MQSHKIALVQQKVEYGNVESNLQRAEKYIGEAKENGCVCAVLPECSDIGWANSNYEALSVTIPSGRSDFFCKLAKENEIYVVVGLTEEENGKYYNSALLISDEGEILGKHRKINLLNDVEPMYSVGDRLGVYETKFGMVGINICADNAQNSVVIGHTLGRMGAQIILSPCSWAVRPEEKDYNPTYPEQWIEPYKALAEQYELSVIGVSNVGYVADGAWQGWSCIGSSVSVMNNKGDISIEVMPYGEDKDMLKVVEFSPRESNYYGVSLATRVEEA